MRWGSYMAASGGASHRRILFASLVGTAVEFYDFYIYATAAALVFGPLFFPSESASAQLMLAYASFGLAFVARPVGAEHGRASLWGRVCRYVWLWGGGVSL